LITVIESIAETSAFQSTSASREAAKSFVTRKSKLSAAEDTSSSMANVHDSLAQSIYATSRAKSHQPLSFVAGDSNYGRRLSKVKAEDEAQWSYAYRRQFDKSTGKH
jgi:hypothetical protein